MRANALILATLAGGLVGFTAARSAEAQTYTWAGPNGGAWDTTTANWSGAGTVYVSSAASSVVFSPPGLGTMNINLTQNVTANAITQSGVDTAINGTFAITLAAPATLDLGLNGNSRHLTFKGPLAGTAGLTINGGQVHLYGASTYTGPTTVNGFGIIRIWSADNRLPVGTDLTLSTVNSALVLSAGSQQLRSLSGAGTVNTAFGPRTLTLSGTPAGAVHTGKLMNDTIAPLTLRKIGSDTQTIGSTLSEYSGGTLIEGGTLIAASGNALGTGDVMVLSGGTLGLSGGTAISNAINISGAGASPGGVIRNISGHNTLAGQVTANGNVTIATNAGSLGFGQALDCGAYAATFSVAANSSISCPTVSTPGTLTKVGSGELNLTSPCEFWTMQLISGRIKVGHLHAINTGGGPIQVTGVLGGSIDLNGMIVSARPFSGGDTTNRITNSSSNGAFLTVFAEPGSTTTFGGVIENGAGPVALGKDGTGTWVLNADQAYTGVTELVVGTLTTNGSLASAQVIVGPQGTLDGNGHVGGSAWVRGTLAGARAVSGLVTLDGGTIKVAGAGQGTLTLDSGLTVYGGTIEMQGPGPLIGYDQILVTGGNVQLGNGSVTLAYTVTGNPPYGPAAKITVINNTGNGTTSGYFAGLPEGAEVISMAGYGNNAHWFIYYNANLATGAITGGNDVIITPQAPSTIRNGGFEQGTGSLGTQAIGSQGITHWTVTRGTVDWASEWSGSDGIRSVDLQGLSSSGGIRQIVSLQPGTRYRLTFGLAGNPEGLPVVKHMKARVNGTEISYDFDITGKTRTNMGWTDKSFAFIGASGNTEIEFYSTDPAGSWGAVVDNVRLVTEPCAVDVAGFGGTMGADHQVTVDDIVAFLSRFFANDRNVCDIVAVGGATGSDGLVTVDDLVAFLSGFFAGCP